MHHAVSSRVLAGTSLSLALILPAVVAGPAQAQGTGVLKGSIMAENGLALSGAEVAVQGTSLRTTTDDRGEFRLAGVSPGAAEVRARRLGFRPGSTQVDVPASGIVEVTLKLPVVVDDLQPVLVRGQPMKYSGRLAGYYERLERRSSGVFVTREEIDRENPRTLSQLLQRVPGVTVQRLRAGNTGIRMRDRTCSPLIWLDGNAMRGGSVDLDSFQPSSFQGIELYLGSTSAPSRYSGIGDTSNCGTILLWSRSGETDQPEQAGTPASGLEDLVASRSVYTTDQVDKPATLDSSPPLDIPYPPSLNAARIQGVVVAEFVVDTQGSVEASTIGIVSSTHPLFAEAVRQKLASARYEPAILQGKPVRQLVHQPFAFTALK